MRWLGCILLIAAPGCSSDPSTVDSGTASVDAAQVVSDARAAGSFSFFVTSLETMRTQSGSEDGFGGDLGGLAGADQICQTAAAAVGFDDRTWHAFLSVTSVVLPSTSCTIDA